MSTEAYRREFEVAGRKAAAKTIRSFRAAMRAGDCKRADVILDSIETGHASRNTKWRLQDQFYSAGCKRRWEKR